MCRDALLHRSHEIQPAFFDQELKFISNEFLFHFFCALRDLFVFYQLGCEFAQVGVGKTQRVPNLLQKINKLHLLKRVCYSGESYLLGLLAKIKCSICSYQLNLWYVAHGVT